jgi:4,4'-diaponeurosporenoate glycosyltransferase
MRALMIAGWLAGWILLWKPPRLDVARPRARPVSMTVVVPARNEATRLPRLLASIAAQNGRTARAAQVLVIDDHSTDGTAELARAVDGVEVVPAPPLPEGWTGKSWACATGVRHAEHEVLCFLDADVELAPDALDALIASWERRGGLLSVQPRHDPRRPVEWLSLPFNVVAVMGLGVGSLVPPRREWGASGPCLVTSRADYERAGGHAAVRTAVAEDLALAECYDAVGQPVATVYGGELVRYRMYRDLRDLAEGWSKNIATGATRTPRLRSLGIALWVAAALTSATSLGGAAHHPVPTAVSYGAWLVQFGVLGRRVGRFGPAAAFWPVLVGFFVALFSWSAVRTLVLRRVRWSGRTVPLQRERVDR